MQTGATPATLTGLDTEFKRGLGLYDSTMVVVGSMIGSGIFLVSAEMSRYLGGAGWLLAAWALTGALTIIGALSYGELAAMMPRAGGQYVYLREAFSPLVGFLYGWTLFLVIQTGTIAAVAVGFARYFGALVPWIDDNNFLVAPIHISEGYALSLSTTQLVGVLLIALLTWTNTRGLEYGRVIQNIFTTAKTGALLGLIAVGLLLGWNAGVVADNFGNAWTARNAVAFAPGLSAAAGAFGLIVAIGLAQTGSLFSSDAWNNITFTAGEVKDPRRTIPLSLAFGTIVVIGLYLLANLAYLVTLPLAGIQNAAGDRVATTMLDTIFPGLGVTMMAVAIMVSTFGCNNGLLLAGARAYYAMARDGLFFRQVGRLNDTQVPGWALLLQGIWASCLVLPRTYNPATNTYGNLYSNLLEYVISAALIFYILTIAGVFRLRRTRPDVERPYRAFGYPVVPALYILGAASILAVLFAYRTATTWPGLAIILLGVPAFVWWRRGGAVAAVVLLLAVQPTSAHHSTSAIFEVSRRVPVTGTLTDVEWINPHVFLMLDVERGGKVEKWKVEANPPAWWRGLGVNRAAFARAIGQPVTIDGHPSKQGLPYIYLRKITFANGDSIEAVQTS